MNAGPFILASLILTGCASAPVQVAPDASATDALHRAVESIQPRDFLARIGFLASDELGGRDTPSPGLDAAAVYMASEFQRAGLEPAGDPGSYLQRWPYSTGAMNVDGSRAETVHHVPNVAGVLRGSDPELRNTYLIISAHIDHVGSSCRGVTPQNTICNGADDNASGSAAIIELAEAFAMLPVKPRRSIVFLGVSGEEKGLLGSRYYAENPTVPAQSIIANINLDMIGRSPHQDTVAALGQAYSSLGPLVQRLNRGMPELRLTVEDDMWPGQNLFFRSDHFSFVRREIPALFFFTGLHDDYHAATDTVEKIDLDQITRITRLVFHLANTIANDPNPPEWDPAGLEEVRRLRSQRR
jgi:hypothetical protein